MEKTVSICGILCSECGAYLATTNDDDEKRRIEQGQTAGGQKVEHGSSHTPGGAKLQPGLTVDRLPSKLRRLNHAEKVFRGFSTSPSGIRGQAPFREGAKRSQSPFSCHPGDEFTVKFETLPYSAASRASWASSQAPSVSVMAWLTSASLICRAISFSEGPS